MKNHWFEEREIVSLGNILVAARRPEGGNPRIEFDGQRRLKGSLQHFPREREREREGELLRVR